MSVMSETRVSRNYWWFMVIRGLAAVLFGLIALLRPGLTLLVLVYFFGAYALVSGVMAVVASIEMRRVFSRWWVVLIEGLAGIAAGLIAFAWPGITALALLYLIAFWAVLTGVLELVAAFSGRMPLALEWTLALAGIFSILFGAYLIILPGAGLLSLVWLTGIYALVFGILLIIRAFQFRSADTALMQEKPV